MQLQKFRLLHIPGLVLIMWNWKNLHFSPKKAGQPWFVPVSKSVWYALLLYRYLNIVWCTVFLTHAVFCTFFGNHTFFVWSACNGPIPPNRRRSASLLANPDSTSATYRPPRATVLLQTNTRWHLYFFVSRVRRQNEFTAI